MQTTVTGPVTRANNDPSNRIETEHLAAEYVEGFELEHLEDVSVKREERTQNARTPSIPPTEWVHSEEPTPRLITHRQWVEDHRRLPPLSPPPSEPMYGPQPVLVNMALVSGDPGTPPETPPISHSPMLTSGCRNGTGLMEEMMWLPQQLRQDQQPLDLRPLHCIPGNPDQDWDRRDYIMNIPIDHHLHHSNGMIPQLLHQRPMSVCSGSQLSPRMNHLNDSGYSTCTSSEDLGISDDLLMKLSVRELNKRLHGFDKDDVMRLKQKRRTLKNRGYAQNCRSKRLQQKQDLEITNRTLTEQLRSVRAELLRVVQERDMLRQRLQISDGSNNRAPPMRPMGNQQQVAAAAQQHGLNSNSESTPEFYL